MMNPLTEASIRQIEHQLNKLVKRGEPRLFSERILALLVIYLAVSTALAALAPGLLVADCPVGHQHCSAALLYSLHTIVALTVLVGISTVSACLCALSAFYLGALREDGQRLDQDKATLPAVAMVYPALAITSVGAAVTAVCFGAAFVCKLAVYSHAGVTTAASALLFVSFVALGVFSSYLCSCGAAAELESPVHLDA